MSAAAEIAILRTPIPETALDQLAAGQCSAVQFGEVPVPLRIVVAGLEDDLPGERPGGDLPEGAKGDRDHNEVAAPGEYLASALSSAADLSPFQLGYTLMAGTSRAAAPVTWGAAMLVPLCSM